MQLTLTGEYAIRAMIHLAQKNNGNVFNIAEISSTNQIPEKFLRKIIPQLSSAGLIQTQRGIGGGIKLARPADEITPLEIIIAVEGEMALNKCLIDKSFCSNERWCTVHTLWCDAQKQLKEILSSKSIAKLAKESTSRKKRIIK
jgi:Rrf2 family protein